MSTAVPELPLENESFASDLAGMPSFFIDPAGAAKRVFTKWFWVGPLVLFSIVSLIVAYMMLPITQHVMETMPVPANASPEQFQRGLELGMKIQRISMWFAPVFAAVIFAVQALILFAMCSVLTVNAKFRWLFNLIAGCSLIQMLAAIASIVILKAKGEVTSMAELRPAMGLDIFLPEGTNKFAVAFLGYFTVFEIWWIVMLVLVMSHAFRITKGKAFGAVLPLILLSIVLRLGVAIFAK